MSTEYPSELLPPARVEEPISVRGTAAGPKAARAWEPISPVRPALAAVGTGGGGGGGGRAVLRLPAVVRLQWRCLVRVVGMRSRRHGRMLRRNVNLQPTTFQ